MLCTLGKCFKQRAYYTYPLELKAGHKSAIRLDFMQAGVFITEVFDTKKIEIGPKSLLFTLYGPMYAWMLWWNIHVLSFSMTDTKLVKKLKRKFGYFTNYMSALRLVEFGKNQYLQKDKFCVVKSVSQKARLPQTK